MIPDKMRAIVIEDVKKAGVHMVSTPKPEAGEICIRLKKCLLCTWEQRIFGGNGDVSLPMIPGHEVSGVVADIPEGLNTTFQIGDPVVVKTLDSCGHCEACYRGQDNQCSGKFKKRYYDGIYASGGLAEYICLPINRIFPLHGGESSMEEAAFAEPVACCLRSLERTDIEMGEDVVIVGAGIMGQLHNVLAKKKGARTIIAEPDQARRDMALSMGADVVFNPVEKDPVEEVLRLTHHQGAHVIFFTVNVLPLAQTYIKALGKMGRMVYYGSFHPSGDIAIDPNHIHYSEKVITGSFSPNTKGFWMASRLLSYGLIDVNPFITQRYKMEDCQQAFERALGSDSYRVLIDLEA